MKTLIACIALAGLAAVGCSTNRDYSGGSDDSRFSTPSWGTSSGMGSNSTSNQRDEHTDALHRANQNDMAPQSGVESDPASTPEESGTQNSDPNL